MEQDYQTKLVKSELEYWNKAIEYYHIICGKTVKDMENCVRIYIYDKNNQNIFEDTIHAALIYEETITDYIKYIAEFLYKQVK